MQSPVAADEAFDFLFKLILIGDSDVGKTCVVQSFRSGVFSVKQQNTIGVDFTVRTLDIDGKRVKVGLLVKVNRGSQGHGGGSVGGGPIEGAQQSLMWGMIEASTLD